MGLHHTFSQLRARTNKRPHFEGAETLLVVLGLVLVAAALAAPRPTAPGLLPLPQADRRTLTRALDRDRELALAARSATLPFDVRAVGETIRRIGAAQNAKDHKANTPPPAGLSGDLQDIVARALREHGTEPLLRLRAVETELFVAATHDWERAGQVPADLRELGGDFAELAVKSRWLSGTTLVLDDRERALLFRARFAELTQLGKDPPFAPTLDERREVCAFLLRHPPGGDAGTRARAQYRAVAELGKIDPAYPAAFARGVLLYRAGAFEAAADEFRAHLAERKDGAFALRAKNHLLAALAQTPPEE